MKAVFKLAVLSLVVLFITSGLSAKEPGAGQNMVSPFVSNDLITLNVSQEIEAQSFELIVTGPGNFYLSRQFEGVSIPFIEIYDNSGDLLADGQYNYELRAIPYVSEEGRVAISAMRERGDSYQVEELVARGVLPQKLDTVAGSFRVFNGFFVVPEKEPAHLTLAAATSEGRPDGTKPGKPVGGADTGGSRDVGADDRDQTRDQVILDDLIVDGSACIGMDCVNGESFGFDTLRLKENNLRIKFDDTSSTGSFPSFDWQLTANDSGNGGANKFSIDDITSGKTPFTIEGSAPNHSLYADDGGRIGMGTSTPVVELHIVDGDSPTIRLEQDGSSGFTAQTWDLAANETNFFVRDVTNGSRLPFRIRPLAPTNSLYINTDGKVGYGTAAPSATIHVNDGNVLVNDKTTRDAASGSASFKVTHTASTATDSHILMALEANGQVNFLFKDTADNVLWKQIMNGGSGTASTFAISRDGSGGNEFVLDHVGNLAIRGNLTQGSDRNRKENFATIDPSEVLAKIVSMPVTTWNYREEDDSVRHMGPVSQDFYAAFGLGSTDLGIGAIDSTGAAFGAIQGLYQELQVKNEEIKSLKDQLAAQEARLKALEDALLK